MGFAETAALGALAGFTIFLGLPVARVRGLGANQRRALEAEFGGEKVAADQVPEGAV